MLSGYSVLGWSAVLATTLRHVGGDPMATARITHRYDDGSVTTFAVEADQMFEGAITEAVDQVLRMYLAAVPDEAE